MKQSIEALPEQSCTDEQHNRARNLDDDELRSEPMPIETRRRASSLDQSLIRISKRHPKCRHESEENHGTNGKGSCETEHPRIQTEFGKERHSSGDVRRDEPGQELDRPVARNRGHHGGDANKDYGFGEKLNEDAAVRRTERRADGHLASSSFRPDEQEARDIHGREQQQQSRARDQHEQNRPYR